MRDIPALIRSDNGPEFDAEAGRDWITAVGAKTVNIEPGSPRENGYRESLKAKFHDGLINVEMVYSLKEAQILIEQWRKAPQRHKSARCLGQSPAGVRDHPPDRPKSDHTVTLEVDHLGRADQSARQRLVLAP